MTSALARDLRSLPNVITLARIALILIAAALYFYVSRPIGIALAVLGGVTDYVDGMVARRTGQVTRLGEILDQFSDLCFEALGILVVVVHGFYPPIVLYLYLLREFWVGGLRRYMAAVQMNIPSSLAGKLKTNVLMWSLLPAYLSINGVLPGLEPGMAHFARASLALGLVLGYVSAWGYTRAFAAGYGRG